MLVLATFAPATAVNVNVSLFVLLFETELIGFADHAAVTPVGSPLTENVMFPVNAPPVAAVRLTVPEAPCTTATELAAVVSASVGVGVTVNA
jgi:hypothetical protein